MKTGDLVTLKSGGPRMTVEKIDINRSDTRCVECVWFQATDTDYWQGPVRAVFPESALEPFYG